MSSAKKNASKKKYTLKVKRQVKTLKIKRNTLSVELQLLQVCSQTLPTTPNCSSDDVQFISLRSSASNHFEYIRASAQEQCAELETQNTEMIMQEQELEHHLMLKDGMCTPLRLPFVPALVYALLYVDRVDVLYMP